MPASIEECGIHPPLERPQSPLVFKPRQPLSTFKDTLVSPELYQSLHTAHMYNTFCSSVAPTSSTNTSTSSSTPSMLPSSPTYGDTTTHLITQFNGQTLPNQENINAAVVRTANPYSILYKDSMKSPIMKSPKAKVEGKFSGVLCQVCGEAASGNFFGATVCLPCKTFFIRCTMEDVRTFRCRRQGDCEIGGPNRSRCKHCRYMKCIQVGMVRKERPERVEITEGQQLCTVCKDVANGIHFGVVSCEGCKKFFRRGLQESESYVCKYNRVCPINPKTRNDCRYCRFRACLAAGMSRDAIKMGRPRKNVHDSPGSPEYGQTNLLNGMTPFPSFSELQSQIMMRNGAFCGTPSADVNHYGQRPHPYLQRDNIPVFPINASRFNVKMCNENTGRVISPQYTPNPAFRGNTAPRIPTPGSLSSSRSESSYESGNDESDIDSPLDCSIKREPASPGDLSPWPLTPNVKSEPPSPPPTEDTAQPPTPETPKQTQPKSDIYLKYMFDEGYWLEPPALRCEDTVIKETEKDLISSITTSYIDFVKALSECADTSECFDTPGDIEKLMQAEIVHQLSTVIKFVQNIPGFEECLPEDKYIIFRLGAIQLCCLVAAVNFYDQSTHNFNSSFYNSKLPESHPLYSFRLKLLAQARHLHSLKLDPVETSLLSAVLMIATDWPCLQCPRTLGRIRARLLKAFKSYTNSKYGVSSKRIEDLFTVVPPLRELGMFHYRITFVM